MKRTIYLILAVLLMVAGSAAPLTAKDHKPDKDEKEDRKITAEACKKNGWKDLATEDEELFKNQGQCVSYAKRGGELIELDDRDDDDSRVFLKDDDESDDNDAARSEDNGDETRLTIVDGKEPWDGYLEGTGFTPGEELTRVTFTSDRETLNLTSPVGTVIDDDGNFTTERIIYWCSEYHGYDQATGLVTVEDSSGETYSQEFEMETHCEPAA